MNPFPIISRSRVALLLVLLFAVGARAGDVPEVDFNRDIRPILSDKCFHCHGPDAQNQKSEFRLDTREHATADLDGVRGIVPGNLDDSEVHWRIRLPNDDIDVMPPLDSNRVLSKREKDLLDAWIAQGAPYDRHWSFKKPEKIPLPGVKNAGLRARIRNPIDAFVFARLEEEGLTPQPEADRETRARRAALTLTGLPPLADAEVKDYESFVDELLASTGYAERQALRWLSAARYADTDGFQNDSPRSNWPWRDWVIGAFHENMPFDQFTIEQLAGDMLPDATRDQILASAFNRNHRQNAEGGALAPEFFVENVIDRVETTSTVWLGLTMGCARCHDHKYDPLSQREFFQLFAYFNNIGEKGIGKGVQANPVMEFRSPLVDPPAELVTALETARAEESAARKSFSQRLNEWIASAASALNGGEEAWVEPAEFLGADVTRGTGELTREDDGSWLFSGQNVSRAVYEMTFRPGGDRPVTGIRLDALPDPAFGKPRQLARSVNGNFVLTEVTAEVFDSRTGKTRPVGIALARAGFEQDRYPVARAIDGNPGSGWAVFGPGVQPETVSAFFLFGKPVNVSPGEAVRIRLAHESQFADHNIGRFRLFFSDTPISDHPDEATLGPKVTSALRTPPARRSAAERKTLTDYFRTIDVVSRRAEKAVAQAEKALERAGAGSVPVMIMRERDGDRMPSYLLDRGQYDAPDRSEELPRAVPAAFFEGTEEEQPRDRLELARWIVSDQNPLTARVIVNRIWQDHFGAGLVKTVEDFGAQSEMPSHPALLDWLAVEFMESGWDVKALHRLIVTSATFQQKAGVAPEPLARDPENRLLARGPRFRLDGFAIRDLALHAAGLLDSRVGGPPVKPYQPAGLWENLASRAGTRYAPSQGRDLFRKSLYTYWKRAVNPPRQLIFDAGGREACDVGLRRTNTPLQALVLMNDVTFLEAARHLAEDVISEAAGNRDAGLILVFRRATGLSPEESQLAVLRDNLSFFEQHFARESGAAARFLSAGASARDESIPAPTHAAWTAVAHLVLNLDTTISVQ